MLNSIILRLVARSADSIVSFFVGLDAKLDKFLAELTDDTPETDNCYDPDLVGRDREEAGCP